MNRISLDDGGDLVYCLIVTDLSGRTPSRAVAAPRAAARTNSWRCWRTSCAIPLAPIRNAAADRQLRKAGDARRALGRATSSSGRSHQLARLVDDLLDVSRITRGKIRAAPSPVDSAGSIAGGIETARPLIQARRHELAVELPPAPVMVHGPIAAAGAGRVEPPQQRRQVHARGWAHLDLRSNTTAPRPRSSYRTTASASAPTCCRGSSIRSPRPTRPWSRSQGGLGIGLALVRTLVEMHHGRVEARSAGPGRGSEFVVTLPMLPASAQQAAAERAPHPDRVAAGTGAAAHPRRGRQPRRRRVPGGGARRAGARRPHGDRRQSGGGDRAWIPPRRGAAGHQLARRQRLRAGGRAAALTGIGARLPGGDHRLRAGRASPPFTRGRLRLSLRQAARLRDALPDHRRTRRPAAVWARAKRGNPTTDPVCSRKPRLRRGATSWARAKRGNPTTDPVCSRKPRLRRGATSWARAKRGNPTTDPVCSAWCSRRGSGSSRTSSPSPSPAPPCRRPARTRGAAESPARSQWA